MTPPALTCRNLLNRKDSRRLEGLVRDLAALARAALDEPLFATHAQRTNLAIDDERSDSAPRPMTGSTR